MVNICVQICILAQSVSHKVKDEASFLPRNQSCLSIIKAQLQNNVVSSLSGNKLNLKCVPNP